MRSHRSILKALAALTLVFLPVTADAQSDPPARLYEAPRFELYLSSLFFSSASEGSFGLRGALSLSPRFALEGSLARVDDDRVDILLADVSAKYYLNQWSRRTDFYVTAGPSLYHSDALGVDEPMVHLGLGAEVDLGPHFYFRPELRGRWFVDVIDSTSVLDLSVGLGWRF